ncbi:hypothetical protein BGZ98_006781 [Dissophora globulifera]|nr:hypothetical protein BGZ98_006781 [Dissophora globulifera]
MNETFIHVPDTPSPPPAPQTPPRRTTPPRIASPPRSRSTHRFSPLLHTSPRSVIVTATEEHMVHLMTCLRDANEYVNAQPDDLNMVQQTLALERQLRETRAYLSELNPTVMDPHLREYSVLIQRYWERNN